MTRKVYIQTRPLGDFSRASMLLLTLILIGTTCGCSTLRRKEPNASPEKPSEAAASAKPALPAPDAAAVGQVQNPSPTAELQARMEAMELKISTLQEKLDHAQQALANLTSSSHARPTPVTAPASDRGGESVTPITADSDPEAGFANDPAVRSYRSAMILFRGAQYPEAVLAFSSFLEAYPDHPLAGTAQFYVGESYLLQKEYKLAVQEFQRVLTSYDRSPNIAQTLREMAFAEDQIKRTADAGRHRQLLMSLFPHSPFATHSEESYAAAQTVPAPQTVADPAQPVHSNNSNKLDEPPPTVPLVAPSSSGSSVSAPAITDESEDQR